MSSSLKISLKIPKSSTEQHTKTASHKAPKRRITSDDESDSAASSRGETSSQKPISKKPRISKGDDADHQPDTRPRSRSSQPSTAKPRAPAGLTKKPPKKKKRIVSDEEDDDEEFVPEPEEQSTGVGMKPKAKDLKGKVKSSASGGAKVTTKNESMPTDASASTPALIGKKRARIEDDLKGKDMDVDVTSVPPAPTASVPAPRANVDPPKKKLPTIKKKPKTDSATGSAFASPGPVLPPKSTVNPSRAEPIGTAKQPAAVALKKPAAPVQATTVNPSGTGDFDLRDMNTWASLIGKGTSSSGPRVGIEKRVSTEERRKQLDKMRNEARARRKEEFQHTFDLQAQSQKIALFEKKFASHKVRIPGPNILGAAFKVRPIPRS